MHRSSKIISSLFILCVLNLASVPNLAFAHPTDQIVEIHVQVNKARTRHSTHYAHLSNTRTYALLLLQLEVVSTDTLVGENAVLDCPTKCDTFKTAKQCGDCGMACVPDNSPGGIFKPFDFIPAEVIDDDDYNGKPGTSQPSLLESNHSLTNLFTTGNLQLACPQSCDTRADTEKCYARGNICEFKGPHSTTCVTPSLQLYHSDNGTSQLFLFQHDD